ncbi:protein PHYTOCHROME KINASE SUBSTRATE 1-like [Dorcoceras hygrometricum]|uniref:Protein PHYTOCHROME KINASE SUBSTRATE 1-like n=1 Tax=Dorcoceras hygrometricum TaxID=472368 RepID=A0A2Z7AS93_9LAMI|nr:protein PHYTOCHROME KINASE SUBSTRATE 1-like [Dorcoceras hygrometricum]
MLDLGLHNSHNTTLDLKSAAPPLPHHAPPPAATRAATCRDRTCSDHRVEEIPFVSNSSVLLVQADEGFVIPVVDLIRRSTAAYNSRASFPVILVGARRLDASKVTIDKRPMNGLLIDFNVLNVSRSKILNFRCALGKRDPDPPLSPTMIAS